MSITSFNVPYAERSDWITIFDSPYYPDFLAVREALHKPTLIEFRQLVQASESSQDLYRRIMARSNPERIQLCRILRKYVSPDTSVEMLKIKTKVDSLIRIFGGRFRPIEEVRERLFARPEDDETLFGILGEYDTRGQKGYDLTALFFEWFEAKFEDENFSIRGPLGAGSDIILSDVLPAYIYRTPADFLIYHADIPVATGFARYDSDRGGSQEDDRTKGNERHASQVISYEPPSGRPRVKVLFINDGPGLLLGSMWNDYVRLEQIDPDLIMVCTLLMLDERLTEQWLIGQ